MGFMFTNYEIKGEDGEHLKRFFCNRHAWRFWFELALEHGWEPMGTGAPDWGEPGDQNWFDQDDWSNQDFYYQYFLNHGQWVEKKDARNLMGAIELALPTHPLKEEQKVFVKDFLEFLRGVVEHNTSFSIL
jgi:hypothetical protein